MSQPRRAYEYDRTMKGATQAMPRSKWRHGGTPSTLAEDKGWYLGIDACIRVLFSIGK